jgi:hypothetical protein
VALKTRFGAARESGISAGGDEEPPWRGIYAFDVDVDRRGDEGQRRRGAVAEEPCVVSRLLGARDDAGQGDCTQSHAERARMASGQGASHCLIVAGHSGFVEARVARAGLARSGGRPTLGGHR